MDRASVVVEQRGSHFVAWVADEAGKPRGTVLMVGQSAEEAEARLSAWWAEAENR
jgi:glycogen synthase